MPPESSFAQYVYRLVRRIPPGRVASYGGVAALLGVPRAARGVGRALAELPPGTDVPWWRVVSHSGALTIGGPGRLLQRALLEAEGVRFRGSRVDLTRHGWRG